MVPLASSTVEIASGIVELANGVVELATGTIELAISTVELATAIAELASGNVPRHSKPLARPTNSQSEVSDEQAAAINRSPYLSRVLLRLCAR